MFIICLNYVTWKRLAVVSSTSSSEEGAEECGGVPQIASRKTVKDCTSVFSKSQTPELRKEKAQSISQIKQLYVIMRGRTS
jgi:hypothetical protein